MTPPATLPPIKPRPFAWLFNLLTRRRRREAALRAIAAHRVTIKVNGKVLMSATARDYYVNRMFEGGTDNETVIEFGARNLRSDPLKPQL